MAKRKRETQAERLAWVAATRKKDIDEIKSVFMKSGDIAQAIEDAYQRGTSLGLDWSRRIINGAGNAK